MSELKTSSTTFYQNGPGGQNPTSGVNSGITKPDGVIYQNGPIGGSGVQIRYDAVIDICEKMIILANELNDQWDVIKNIINAKDEYWRGEAADRFFEDINVDYNAAKEITSSEQMLKYIQKVKELVENNKKTDTVITENDITKINEMLPTFSFLTIGQVSDGIDNDLLGSVKTNDNITSESVNKVSEGIDNEALGSVKTTGTETDSLKYTGNSDVETTVDSFTSSTASINTEENK